VTLDEAWAEAEAALPTGWQIAVLYRDGTGQSWIVESEQIENLPFGGHVPGNPTRAATGPTPAAALRALAVALQSQEAGE
jgi:hypothetical protein